MFQIYYEEEADAFDISGWALIQNYISYFQYAFYASKNQLITYKLRMNMIAFLTKTLMNDVSMIKAIAENGCLY